MYSSLRSYFGYSQLIAKLAKKPKKGSIIPAPKPAFGRSEAPTTVKARLAKAETTPSSEEPESSDDESDDEEEETMHPPIPATRPTKALDAVKYDTIKTLWRVPYRSVEGDDIRKGLTEFWEIIRTIRDRWKSDSLAAKAAEDAKKVNEIPLLKERVENQRDILEAVLDVAVAEGHRDIVEQYVFLPIPCNSPVSRCCYLSPLSSMYSLHNCAYALTCSQSRESFLGQVAI